MHVALVNICAAILVFDDLLHLVLFHFHLFRHDFNVLIVFGNEIGCL